MIDPSPEGRAIAEWNRLTDEFTKRVNDGGGVVPAALQYSAIVLVAHALVIGLTCISAAIRERDK